MRITRWIFALQVALLAGLASLPTAGVSHAQQDTETIGVLFAAGDIANCVGSAADGEALHRSGKTVANLIDSEIAKLGPAFPREKIRILALGDLAYPCGSTANFKCFDDVWKHLKSLILPVPGNHDDDPKAGTPPTDRCVSSGQRGLGPYMTYFSDNPFVTGARDGVASVRFPDPANGPWLLVGLNTYGGGVSINRLSTLLREETAPCVLAFSHAPLYSSGRHGHGQNSAINLKAALKPQSSMRGIFNTLHEHRASLLLAGHDHHYEQLGRANANATAAKNGQKGIAKDGVRSFVVGTGGTKLHSDPPGGLYRERWAFQEAYDIFNRGVLKIELKRTSYKWEFIPTGPSKLVVKPGIKMEDTCNKT